MPFAASFIALAAALAYLALGFAARRIFNRRRRASIPSDPEKALFTRALQFDDSEMEIQSTGCCGGGGDPRSLPESWTWSVLTASDDSLILRALSSNGGYFDYEIGPGGCLATIRTKEGTVLTAPTYRGEVNDRLACMIVLWGNGVTLDLPGRPNRRWNVNLGGTPRANAPVYAVEMSGDGRTLDVWSTAGDQFDPQLEGRMVTRLACRHRYQLEEDGVLMITRTMLFGATTVDGHPRDLNDMCR